MAGPNQQLPTFTESKKRKYEHVTADNFIVSASKRAKQEVKETTVVDGQQTLDNFEYESEEIDFKSLLHPPDVAGVMVYIEKLKQKVQFKFENVVIEKGPTNSSWKNLDVKYTYNQQEHPLLLCTYNQTFKSYYVKGFENSKGIIKQSHSVLLYVDPILLKVYLYLQKMIFLKHVESTNKKKKKVTAMYIRDLFLTYNSSLPITENQFGVFFKVMKIAPTSNLPCTVFAQSDGGEHIQWLNLCADTPINAVIYVKGCSYQNDKQKLNMQMYVYQASYNDAFVTTPNQALRYAVV